MCCFFLFRSSTYTLAASFIHFRQLCKRSLFFICVMIYHCYFCDCFFFHSRLCLKIHFCYDSWPVSSGIHIYNLSPIYWHLFILTVLVSVWHVMYAYCIARYVKCVYKNNSITMLLRFVPNVFQYLNKRPWSDPLERRRKDGNQENLATLYLRELTWIAAF